MVAVGWLAAPAAAQQTIVNVPSDALTPKGRFFYLHESALSWNKGTGGYTTTNFFTYGLTDNTELAATVYNVNPPGAPFASLGLGFKSTFDVLTEDAPKLDLKFTVGHMTPVSFRPGVPALGFFSYSHFAWDVPETPFRLLLGVAGGSRNIYGVSAVSAIAGLEFPIIDHLSFTGEWFSGTHNLSALVPGLTYHDEDLILVGGIKIPNNFDRNDYGVIFEVGYFFGGSAEDKRRAKEREKEEKAGKQRHYGTRAPRFLAALGLGD